MTVINMRPFGVELEGVDLSSWLADASVDEIERLLHNEGAVLFRDQNLDDRGQVAFASRFGMFSQVNPEDIESHVYRVNNREGFGATSELQFHADNMFTLHPLKYLMLYGLDLMTDGVPLQGGETMLASAATAVDRLPPEILREVETLECRMSVQQRQGYHETNSCIHPCIRTHPVTGQRYIVISECMTKEIIGVDPQRGAELISEVTRVLYDEAFVYRHQWREGDLLMWDNRLLQHARRYYDNSQSRVLRRSAIADDNEPTAVAP